MNEAKCFTYADGTQVWRVGGMMHRLDGPAFTAASGAQAWCIEGRRHRLDGPARIFPDGSREWWVFGKKIPFDIVEFFRDLGIEDADDETKLAVLRMKMAATDAGTPSAAE